MHRHLITLAFFALTSLSFAADMVLESGPYKIHFEAQNSYCSAQYFYDGVELGGRRGYYGTILSTTGPNKFIGAGHKEGGSEKLLSTKLSVDSKETTVALQHFKGENIAFEKVSMLGNLKTTVQWNITPKEITIRKFYEAVEAQPIYSFYIFQFCWSMNNDQWMIGRPDGTTKTGRFNSDGGWFLCRKTPEPELLWFAQCNTTDQKGILGYFTKYFRHQGSYMFWDVNRYHKFYFSASCPKVAPKGYRSPEYIMVLQGFSGNKDNWMTMAKKQADELQKRYPLPPPPAVQEPMMGKDLTIQGKGVGKFHCVKIPIELEANQTYEMSFTITKGTQTSAKATDNQVLIGQYDRAHTRFQSIKSFATRVPRDGQPHEIRDVFVAPKEIVDPQVYIYNIGSKDTVRIQNVKIARQKK